MARQGVLQPGYRGRVRTGCMTCRMRKVRCDEAKPACYNCTRLRRQCIYKAKNNLPLPVREEEVPAETPPNNAVNESSPMSQTRGNSHHGSSTSPTSQASNVSRRALTVPTPPPSSPSLSLVTPLKSTLTPASTPPASSEESLSHFLESWIETTKLEHTLQGQRRTILSSSENLIGSDLPSVLISRDIELTTTIDLLNTRGLSTHLAAYFKDEVVCPGITPFDKINWQHAKHHIAFLGETCPAIAYGITAVAALHKSIVLNLANSRALVYYSSAKCALEELLKDPCQDFNSSIVVVFLLCLFELLHSGEIVPTLKSPTTIFIERLVEWASLPLSSHSPLSVRLVVWLKIIQSMTLRGGGQGLLEESVHDLLPDYTGLTPNLDALPGQQDECMPKHMFQLLSAPLFDFYFRLQLLSGELARLTHYHRSRSLGSDQNEVVCSLNDIKLRLRTLWDSRPTIQRQTPQTVCTQLAPCMSGALLRLIGICNAAYHAEFVEIDRILGDPLLRWTDSREALQAIRKIVDEDRQRFYDEQDNCDAWSPNPGYVRALFLFAIECMDTEQSRWAVERIAEIRSPIYHSAYFSAFAKALSDAQILRGRRVTSKYYSVWYFGTPPPYM
ncbi:hypothetical protein SEPCBS119000_006223 [Sporothrix epigloea]|uniref:Zn(2)-C6 fungal-type domain-containing protein n=1 Tax=Sporothrix epigloea TaxID=1892477 RepID=A0ABP0E275_9PEZI